MKKLFLLLIISTVFSTVLSAQKVEVLYFKANLSCCAARACSALEHSVKEIIENNFSTDDVAFKQVLMTVRENASLVEKYNARSQTVVIIKKGIFRDRTIDVSDIVKEHSRPSQRKILEEKLTEKINSVL